MGYKQYLQQKGYASKTIENNYNMVLMFISWLDIENMETENVRHNDLLAYINQCRKNKVSTTTTERYLNAIRHFYDYLLSTGKTDHNPTLSIQLQNTRHKKLYHIFKPEELQTLYTNYTAEDLITKRNKIILGLFIWQGIQTAELGLLEVSHVLLREGKIIIPPTKRSNERTLQLEAAQVLDIYDYVLQVRKEILSISGQETERLLVSSKGGNDISNYVTGLIRSLKRKNKLIVNAQQIRASVITKWLRQHNLREVQYRAGHRFVSSTEAFLQNEIEGLKENIQRFHPLG